MWIPRPSCFTSPRKIALLVAVWGNLLLFLTSLPAPALTNVALGGRFVTDGAWAGWGSPGSAAFDGSTAEWSGPQAGGGVNPAATNRLFGVRLPAESRMDSVQLFITGGPGAPQNRSRPQDVRVYYEGGSFDLVLLNDNSVVAFPWAVTSPWIIFRELSVYENNGDHNYFLNEMRLYDSTDTPVNPAAWTTRVTGIAGGTGSICCGGSLAAVADGAFSHIGAYYVPTDSPSGMSFTANLALGQRIERVAFTWDFTDTSNADRVAWNMLREITLQFNDPANTTFTLGELNPNMATGRTYDLMIPQMYEVIDLPGPVTGASQVLVTITRQDPEPNTGPGPATPTLPIGTRKTWGTAAVDNNRIGIIEFEAFGVPEPSVVLLLALGGLLLRGRAAYR